MRLGDHIGSGKLALSEGSVYERLRRDPSIIFDPQIAHGGLIYDDAASKLLEKIHREYLDVGHKYGMAMFALTDTWRCSKERVDKSDFRDKPVNQDNAVFLDGIRASYGNTGAPIFLGGLMGPKGDAYKPEEAPPREEAENYHTPQVEALARTAVDFLYASTLPAFPEALGMAVAMARTGLPYILSFVVRPDGRLLDSTPLQEVIQRMDDALGKPPTGYAVNCVHSSVFYSALTSAKMKHSGLLNRIVSFQANTSTKRPEELDRLEVLETAEPEQLADLMVKIHMEYKTPFMGGCCGTNSAHIESLARKYQALIK